MVGNIDNSLARLTDLRAAVVARAIEFQQERSSGESFEPGRSVVRYAGRVFGPEELAYATEAVLDFWLTAGRFTEQFEQEFAQWVGVDNAILVNSGSSANLVAVSTLTSPSLRDRRLKDGDEVVTVAAGFPTTVAPILQNRLVPVFVDISIPSYNAIPEQIDAAIGPRTRAIILAHTLGNPWNVDAVLEIARRHKLWVIEDNCDALGTLYRGRKTGTFGDIATSSFYPAHHITMGEGGAVVTKSDDLARIARSFRDWGRDCYCSAGENNTCGRRFGQQFGSLPFGYDHKYVYSHLGYNLKATDIQAAIGCAQLKRLDGFCAVRRANHAFLLEGLARYNHWLILPEPTPQSDPSWFSFTITVRPEAPFTRADLTTYLEQRKIETRALFSGNLLRHPALDGVTYRTAGSLENSDTVTFNTFFVGCYPGLGTPELQYVRTVFDEFMASR